MIGVREDPFAEQNRVVPEVDMPPRRIHAAIEPQEVQPLEDRGSPLPRRTLPEEPTVRNGRLRR